MVFSVIALGVVSTSTRLYVLILPFELLAIGMNLLCLVSEPEHDSLNYVQAESIVDPVDDRESESNAAHGFD